MSKSQEENQLEKNLSMRLLLVDLLIELQVNHKEVSNLLVAKKLLLTKLREVWKRELILTES